MEATTMQPRMTHPVVVIPKAYEALLALSKSARRSGLPASTATMVHLRASQINGCAFCVEMHARELRETGESEERISTVAAWRDAPYFDDAERVALELAEAVTRMADQPDPVSDELWEEATRHYDDEQLASLLVEVAVINVWNHLNVPTRQPAGTMPG